MAKALKFIALKVNRFAFLPSQKGFSSQAYMVVAFLEGRRGEMPAQPPSCPLALPPSLSLPEAPLTLSQAH